MENFSPKTLKKLPLSAGVYLFADRQGNILYVGKAINLKERVKSYLKPFDTKTKILASQIKKVHHIKVFSEFEALLLEANLIKKYQPKYNIKLKDGKSFLYIAISAEEFPKVMIVRKNDLIKPKYLFGPFPSSKTVDQVLRFLRKVVPFCSQKGNQRPCFWSHLKLCYPCPGEIEKLTGEERKKQKKIYLNNIKNLLYILNGKTKDLIKNLTKKMNEASKLENFELAAFYRNQIRQLHYVTHDRHSLSSFLENSNFFEEEKEKELEELGKLLKQFSLNTLCHPRECEDLDSRLRGNDNGAEFILHRIECFDISNLSGLLATGSMVVFTNGVPSKKDYRRFKIKQSSLPNDVAMMAEMISRRLKHHEWNYPDLIVVDGGKPQVSVALEVIQRHCEHSEAISPIPVIGLAKRLEEIVLRMENGKWRIDKLPINSPALNLLKRIRDESHRFALIYHRRLRTKNLLV